MNLENVDISKLPADVRKKFLQLQVMHAEKKIQHKAQDDFLSFVKCVWPDFIEGAHHKKIANKFNELSEGKIKRLIINLGTFLRAINLGAFLRVPTFSTLSRKKI